ncbi:MAG: hypothetical protein U0263_12785 [Polyangiaceae bacterium]
MARRRFASCPAARDRSYLLPLSRWLLPLLTPSRVHAGGRARADLKPANVMFRAPGEPVLSTSVCTAQDAAIGAGAGLLQSGKKETARGASEDLYALGRLVEDVGGARAST